jgi:hypothetical protein
MLTPLVCAQTRLPALFASVSAGGEARRARICQVDSLLTIESVGSNWLAGRTKPERERRRYVPPTRRCSFARSILLCCRCCWCGGFVLPDGRRKKPAKSKLLRCCASTGGGKWKPEAWFRSTEPNGLRSATFPTPDPRAPFGIGFALRNLHTEQWRSRWTARSSCRPLVP